MISVLQRVKKARVEVGGEVCGQIDQGLLVLVAVEPGDTQAHADKLLHKLLNYRVFNDAAGKMNLSLKDVAGGLLLVSQFTLAADTAKGTRASFTPAAPPDEAERLFNEVVALARSRHPMVATGEFGAEMTVSLVNHGPVTFRLTA